MPARSLRVPRVNRNPLNRNDPHGSRTTRGHRRECRMLQWDLPTSAYHAAMDRVGNRCESSLALRPDLRSHMHL